MRGPLLSGPLGSTASLERLYETVRARSPVVVLSALWLAEALGQKMSVLAVIESDKHRAAKRFLGRRTESPVSSWVVEAGEALPLAAGRVGAFVLEGLHEIEDDGAASDFLSGLLPLLAPGAVVVAADATKDPLVAARVAGLFLASSLIGIEQERPRDGAVFTVGRVPPAAVVTARVRASALPV